MRIWYSDAPYAVCGLYQVCSMLKDCDCPVLVVKLPEYQLKKKRRLWFIKAGARWAIWIYWTLQRMRSRSAGWRCGITQIFGEELVKENAPLRAVVNGRLVSVPADFYDFMVEGGIEERPFKECKLIGHALDYQMGVSDDLFLESAQRLIDDGRLVVVDDEDIEWDGERLLRRAEDMVSCCGLDCLECEAYDKTCRGCDRTEGKPFWLKGTGDKTCRIYHCCVERKSFRHCGECVLHKYIKNGTSGRSRSWHPAIVTPGAAP